FELAVQEAAQRQLGRNRVDVRQAGQVADDRADRAAPSTPGREDVARDGCPPHFEGDLARQLQHLPVQEEEAGEAELFDERKLLVETRPGALLVTVRPAVALLE